MRLCAVILLLCSPLVVAENIRCSDFIEYVHDFFDNIYGVTNKSCVINDPTEIIHDDTTFSAFEDTNVDGLLLSRATTINYLPVRIYQSYPNIIGIYAASRDIEEISKKNFQRLVKLKYLFLNSNEIKRIKSDTFEDLVSIEVINLEYNKIQQMNGMLYDGLPVLRTLYVYGNRCTNETFYHYFNIQKLPGLLTETCGYEEARRLLNLTCGAGSISTNRISGGTQTEQGQFPFAVAIVRRLKKEFHCGGNLINANHVVTAAHCIKDKRSDINLRHTDLAVYVGRHNISKEAYEADALLCDLEMIHIHPRWSTSSLKYNSDVAILVLDREVDFSAFIKPICLTDDPIVNKFNTGVVVGWGKGLGPHAHEDVPRQVTIKAVSTETCFAKDSNLKSVHSEGMFCAGGDEEGPCQGDSGGGFYVKVHGFWTLRGIVSLGLTKTSGVCDVSTFALYTNLIDYADWIKNIVEPPERARPQIMTSRFQSSGEASKIYFPGDPILERI